jgi:DNA-binding LacI/PurR family transcriptional regulator
MAITIHDVARLAGVSTSTASRALNRRPDVSKEVRARVQAAAKELNYAVNLHARALKGATSKTLGVILYNSRLLSFSAAIMEGIHDISLHHGYSVIVCNAHDAAAERQAYQMLLEKRVDGLLINSLNNGVEPLKRLATENIPFVLINRRVDNFDCDYVMVNYQRGSYLATCHLLEQGHRRILCQLGAPQHSPSQERLRGYCEALEEFGVPFEPELVIASGQVIECYDLVLETMRRLKPAPTAILAYNDEAALPVLKALRELKLRVPEDVAVTGQNDLFFAPFLVPALTSVAQSVYEMGRRSTEILFEKIRWPQDTPWATQQVIYEPKLVVRDSSVMVLPSVAAER